VNVFVIVFDRFNYSILLEFEETLKELHEYFERITRLFQLQICDEAAEQSDLRTGRRSRPKSSPGWG
jgi:hypothetical protein